MLLIFIGTTQTHNMAQETNTLIQVSNDGANWTDLVTLSNGTVAHKHSGLTLGTTKYYRTIAKGDGVNTLDSDPSTVVNVASGFVQRYQDVIDRANALSLGTPSFTQNLINDNIVRNLINQGYMSPSSHTEDKLDILWYALQENGTPYEFMTLNWLDPVNHRLVNAGIENVSWVEGKGFKSLNDNQYFRANYSPDSGINSTKTDFSVTFNLFDGDPTKSSRIFGSASQGTDNVNAYTTANGTIKCSLHTDYIQEITNPINSHYQLSRTNTVVKFFSNGSNIGEVGLIPGAGGVSSAELYLFANNSLGTIYPVINPIGLKYFVLGKKLEYDDRTIFKILNSTYNFQETTKDGVIGFTIAATSVFPSLYYPKVYKSEPYKQYFTGLTKNYIVFYSTNHGGIGSTPTPANGAIGWGECDHPDLSGYVDKGIVAKDTANPLAGYQSETPSVIINPNDPNGQPIWFFYHPNGTYPDTGGLQQTRLLTASGGIGFNDVLFTDRGKVLGITPTESGYSVAHTGYADAYVESDGSITIIHITKNWSADTEAGIPNVGKSTCLGNSYLFNRIDSDMDITSFMPYFRQFHHSPSLFFTRNAIQYVVGRNANFIINDVTSSSKISLLQCDGNYHPISFLGNISGVDSGNNNSNAGYYIEGDTLYVYYIMNLTELYVTNWDLKNLD